LDVKRPQNKSTLFKLTHLSELDLFGTFVESTEQMPAAIRCEQVIQRFQASFSQATGLRDLFSPYLHYIKQVMTIQPAH
jgi:hypothetical protein